MVRPRTGEFRRVRLVGLSSSVSLPLPLERLVLVVDFVAGGSAVGERCCSVMESRSFAFDFPFSLSFWAFTRALERSGRLVEAVFDDEGPRSEGG